MTLRSPLVTASLLVCLSLSVGCRRTPSDLREWTAADHDSGPFEPPPEPTPQDPLSAARALWATHCVECHGDRGRGDGPQAAMFRPADLSDPALQGARSDADLAATITSGRGRMPSFSNRLRPEAVQQLVRLIRTFRR